MRFVRVSSLALAIVVLAAVPALAEVIQFTLLPNYSRATFKTDAPLETIMGHAVAAASTGSLTLDPARPQDAKGVVTVDMSQKPIEVMAGGRVVWIKLTPEQVEGQKRFGVRFGTLLTNHAMQVPQLLFLKVLNEIAIETDLTFVRQ